MKQILKYDILLQWRQGFWLIYFIVSLAYLIILFSIPTEYRLELTMFFIMSDTSILGVTFVGALILLEKQQNVLQSLFVTPLSIRHYLISKTISLTLIALSMSLLISIPSNPFEWNLMVVFLTVLLTSFMFTLFGLGISAKVNTINQYLGRIILFSLGIIIPVIPFLWFDNMGWLVIHPVNAALDIMISVSKGAINKITYIELLLLIPWTIGAYYYAVKQFNKFILNT